MLITAIAYNLNIFLWSFIGASLLIYGIRLMLTDDDNGTPLAYAKAFISNHILYKE